MLAVWFFPRGLIEDWRDETPCILYRYEHAMDLYNADSVSRPTDHDQHWHTAKAMWEKCCTDLLGEGHIMKYVRSPTVSAFLIEHPMNLRPSC